MNRALARTSASVTVVPYESQLFQPIGGRHAFIGAVMLLPFPSRRSPLGAGAPIAFGRGSATTCTKTLYRYG